MKEQQREQKKKYFLKKFLLNLKQRLRNIIILHEKIKLIQDLYYKYYNMNNKTMINLYKELERERNERNILIKYIKELNNNTSLFIN